MHSVFVEWKVSSSDIWSKSNYYKTQRYKNMKVSLTSAFVLLFQKKYINIYYIFLYEVLNIHSDNKLNFDG